MRRESGATLGPVATSYLITTALHHVHFCPPARTMTNFKLAFRNLAKTPFVTAMAIVSLALGIGANAAIFFAVRPNGAARPTGTGHPSADQPHRARPQARLDLVQQRR